MLIDYTINFYYQKVFCSDVMNKNNTSVRDSDSFVHKFDLIKNFPLSLIQPRIVPYDLLFGDIKKLIQSSFKNGNFYVALSVISSLSLPFESLKKFNTISYMELNSEVAWSLIGYKTNNKYSLLFADDLREALNK
ncbi:hypothetical protein BpHYR1_001632 [Brachionus plicatilis]|uniref:Uncharacterized protein n=1 Tax=Brachionus plicatilis TaxID=10195 RepID=A0A3M7P6D1_BRAPC|nr:hypothetical protein BpHYR1_001632 [Brachionus plicatilis]